jgi:hypothetical protein
MTKPDGPPAASIKVPSTLHFLPGYITAVMDSESDTEYRLIEVTRHYMFGREVTFRPLIGRELKRVAVPAGPENSTVLSWHQMPDAVEREWCPEQLVQDENARLFVINIEPYLQVVDVDSNLFGTGRIPVIAYSLTGVAGAILTAWVKRQTMFEGGSAWHSDCTMQRIINNELCLPQRVL